MKIHKIIYDLIITSYEIREVGQKYKLGECKRIEEHLPKHSGDKLYYNIYYDSGEIERTTTMIKLFYKE